MLKRELENIQKEYNSFDTELKDIVFKHLKKIKSYLNTIDYYADFDSNIFCKKIGNAINDIYYLSSNENLLILDYLRKLSYLKHDRDIVINVSNIELEIKIILENKEVDYMYK